MGGQARSHTGAKTDSMPAITNRSHLIHYAILEAQTGNEYGTYLLKVGLPASKPDIPLPPP